MNRNFETSARVPCLHGCTASDPPLAIAPSDAIASRPLVLAIAE